VLPPSINERRDRPPPHVVEAAPGEREARRLEIDHWGREIQLPEKPRLDGVLIGRSDIQFVTGLERSRVTIDHLRDQVSAPGIGH
jgi:hypothetical protein